MVKTFKLDKIINLLDLCNISKGAVPVFKEFCLLIIVNSNVEVVKCSRIEIIYFLCYIEYITHPVRKTTYKK